MSYKMIINTRDYKNYSVIDASNSDIKHDLIIDARKNRMFVFDIFNMEKTKCNIVHSSIRNQKQLSGILQLSIKVTYGRKGKKILYKCIPDDKRLPFFIIPYKQMSKAHNTDKYIIFKFDEWLEGSKYPKGTIVETIGDVTKLENYYEYQLYCNSLYTSIKNFNVETIKKLHNTTVDDIIKTIDQTYDKVEDRTEHNIFTIDPEVSKDFDDAISLTKMTKSICIVSVYITNVTLWLDVLNLWNSFSRRVSTIYLPDRKRPMLPTILSDNVCSLKEQEIRYALCLDLHIGENYEIVKYEYKNTKIKVSKNYRYEEPDLLMNKDYQKIVHIIKQLNSIKNQHYCENISDSHDVVSYLMILMNYYSSKHFIHYKNGIYRSLKLKENTYKVPENLSKDIKRFIKIWSSNGSKYILFDEEDKRHDMFKFDEYVHITSPIRRLVDLLNIIILQSNLGLIHLSKEISSFIDKWINRDSIDYINNTMRSIRKVQNNCALMHKCLSDETIFDKLCDGCIVDKMERNDKSFQYIVYIKDIGYVGKLICFDDYNLYDVNKYKLVYFEDKETLKKKIRIAIHTERN